MNVDTAEFMALRGQVNGLSVAVDELRGQDERLADVEQLVWGLGPPIAKILDRMEQAGWLRPGLRAIEGGGRGGGRHRRAKLELVRREAAQ